MLGIILGIIGAIAIIVLPYIVSRLDLKEIKLAMGLAELQRTGKVSEHWYSGIKTGEANTTDQPNVPVQSASKYKYVHDPSSGYTDMGIPYFGGKSVMDKLDDSLKYWRDHDEWQDIRGTTLQFLRELAVLQPGKWEGKLAKQEERVSGANDMFREALKGLAEWIELGYKEMEKPGVKVDPAYRAAFEAKVQEARDFIATAGQRR